MTPAAFAAFTRRRAAPLVWRCVTGSAATLNPPTVTGSVSLAVDALAGATSIALRASYVTGRLLPGDKLTLAGVEHTVTAASAFAAVATTPPLGADAAAGTPVVLAFAADHEVTGRIADYRDAEKPAGWQAGDMKVILAAEGLGFVPAVEHVALFDGRVMRAVSRKERRWAGALLGWQLQVRE